MLIALLVSIPRIGDSPTSRAGGWSGGDGLLLGSPAVPLVGEMLAPLSDLERDPEKVRLAPRRQVGRICRKTMEAVVTRRTAPMSSSEANAEL